MGTSESFLCALGVAVGTAFRGTRLRPRYAGLPSTSSYGTGLAQLAPAARRTGASLIRPSLRKLSACTIAPRRAIAPKPLASSLS